MSDKWVVASAFAVMVGSLLPWCVPIWFLCCLAIVYLVSRARLVFILMLVLCVSALAFSAWHGLTAPLPQTIDGTATVVADSEKVHGAIRVFVRHESRRYQVWTAANVFENELLTGQHVYLRGEASELSGNSNAICDVNTWPEL